MFVGVKYIVCSSMEGCQNTIVSKNNNLMKYKGKYICTLDGIPNNMKVGNVYTATNCGHMKAYRTWTSKKPTSMAKQVVFGLVEEYKQKGV